MMYKTTVTYITKHTEVAQAVTVFWKGGRLRGNILKG